MDWTTIITSVIAMFSALGVAYIGHSVRKDNHASSDAIQEKFARIEDKFNVIEEKISRQEERFGTIEEKFATVEAKIGRQEEKLASIAQCMGRQEAQLENIDKRLRDQESAAMIHQVEFSKIRAELSDNNLRTLRLDLDRAIDTDPDNTMVIMEMAQKYFVEMHGNCYMSKKFQEWANDHKVNITGLFNKD